MAYEKKVFGELPDGRQVTEYTLTNESGVSASFIDLGGTWVSMMVPDLEGQMEDVVLGYDKLEHYMKNPPHFGAPIGRNANRIGGAKFSLNGITYPLAVNNGPNNLHSGPDLYHSRLWEVQVEEEEIGTVISFSLNSPDGDQGYPGNADITVTYTLTPDNSLILNYHMISDADTVANFTNHSYFNLAGHKHGFIMDQRVWIDADGFTITDEVLIPTGEIVPVEGTPMNFRVMKAIGGEIEADYQPLKIAGGYDHNWVLNHPAGEVSLAAKAVDDKSGRVMEVYTDLPGMQFYTANFLIPELPGKGGAVYEKRSAYCFETQYYPDAVNIPSFPSPVLKAGEEYKTTTVYKFSLI